MGRPVTPNEADSQSGATLDAAAPSPQFPNIPRDFKMRIARDGTWFYRGSPIGRLPLVKLFSTVLRRDENGVFWLTTPVENGQIDVEDAPFLAVELIIENAGADQILKFRTNVDDIVTLDDAHPLRVVESEAGEPRPYVMVRNGLEARLARAVFYQLVDVAQSDPAAPDVLGVRSAGRFFPLGRTQ
jgi:hypothetical protein